METLNLISLLDMGWWHHLRMTLCILENGSWDQDTVMGNRFMKMAIYMKENEMMMNDGVKVAE